MAILTANPSAQSTEPKALFVTTSISQFNGAENGTYLKELAVPFDYLMLQGIEIDIVSPNGSVIPLYHAGDTTPELASAIDSELFKLKTTHTLRPNEVDPSDYSAVIIPGGYGQFLDIHKNEAILNLISRIYESGGVIGSLGHSTATLIEIKLSSGKHLVEGVTMTSFPTWNERNIMKQSNYGKLLPYDMEEELRKRGANLKVYNHEQKINYEVVDAKNRIVTASFANSGEFVVQQIYKLIFE